MRGSARVESAVPVEPDAGSSSDARESGTADARRRERVGRRGRCGRSVGAQHARRQAKGAHGRPTTRATKCTRWSLKSKRASPLGRRRKPSRSPRTSSLRGWRRGSARTTTSSGATAVCTRPTWATSGSFRSAMSTRLLIRLTEHPRPSTMQSEFAFLLTTRHRPPDQVETWQDVNDGRDGGEHILIAIDVPETTLDRIRNVIGMGQVLEAETESHDELEREQRTDKRRLESSVSDLLKNAAVHTVHDYRGERPSVLEDVVEDQVQAVFGSTRKVLSRPLVEVDDAKGLAKFFRGSGDWPLADSDAVMLGVDTSSTEIADTGWCRASSTRTSHRPQWTSRRCSSRHTNGKWGLPRHPARIDRGVAHHARDVQREGCAQAGYRLRDRPDGNRSARTDEGRPSRRCRFGSASIQSTPKRFERSCRRSLATIPTVATLTRGWPSLPRGSRTTACWSSGRSRASPESSTSPLTRWRAYWNRRTAAVTPPHRSWWRTASSPKRRRSQMHANSLLSTGSEGALGTVHRYPRSAGGTLPQCDHYLTDADDRGEWIRTDKDDSELTAGGCD